MLFFFLYSIQYIQKQSNNDKQKTKTNKLWKIKVIGLPIVVGALGTIPKELVKELEDLEIRGGVYPDYNIIKIGKNTEESPGNLRRLAVSQILVKNYQLSQVRKTL